MMKEKSHRLKAKLQNYAMNILVYVVFANRCRYTSTLYLEGSGNIFGNEIVVEVVYFSSSDRLFSVLLSHIFFLNFFATASRILRRAL